ncbi:MAG: hypothetical protein K5928_07940 [Prevotella sp.]|nr:hypothetical protein [Prevotella sp.]
MKKTYSTPTIEVVKLQQQGIICASDVTSVSGNADLNYGGDGSGSARARSYGGSDWDDEWE